MSFEAVNLTDRIGSEIHADVESLLNAEAGAALRRLLVERGVLVFRQLNPSAEQQMALARLLGTLREELGKGIYKITLDKRTNAHADYLKGSFNWHIDGTHDDIPPFATLLTARRLSNTGGRTEFANSCVAYSELPRESRDRIDDLKVVHSVETSMRRANVEPTEDNLAYWRRFPDRVHSLVWRHRSGRRSLVIGCHASHVADMGREEGQTLLQELLDWTTREQFVYRHDWTPGDTLVWDNTGVLHRVEPYPLDSGREMDRSTLLGEEPFG